LNLPLNSEFAQTYQPTGGVNVAVGLNFSPSVELSLDFDYTHFNSANDSLTGGYYMSQMDLALLFKYRFLTEDVRPYLFAGPGMGGHYFVWDYRIGNLYASETVRDTVCFMAEAGAGLEIKIRKGLLFYVQGKMSTDFSGSDLNGFIPVGSPIQYVPLQAGIILGN
jgi:hypothetical protein